MTCFGHAIALLSIMIPTALLVLAFSVTGFGDVTYIGLNAWDWPWYAAAAVDVLLLLLLWMLDAPSWTRPILVALRRVCVLVLIAVAGVACSLATKVYPFAPLQFSLLLIPATAFCMRQLFLPLPASSAYLASMSRSLLATATLLTLYFCLWVFALPPPPRRFDTGWNSSWVNIWGGEVKTYWRHRLRCDPFNATSAALPDSDCYDAAFLWWFFPLLVALSLALASVACRLLSRMLARATAAESDAAAVKVVERGPWDPTWPNRTPPDPMGPHLTPWDPTWHRHKTPPPSRSFK